MTRQQQAIERFETAQQRAEALRVSDSDRNGPGSEPVTANGYYRVPTVSGREAWAYYAWKNGHVREVLCTYAPDAERERADAAACDPRQYE